jgi:hypothetical protein
MMNVRQPARRHDQPAIGGASERRDGVFDLAGIANVHRTQLHPTDGLDSARDRRVLLVSFATGIASMPVSLLAGFERWAWKIGRSRTHLSLHTTVTLAERMCGEADRIDRIVLITSLCLASSLCVLC